MSVKHYRDNATVAGIDINPEQALALGKALIEWANKHGAVDPLIGGYSI